MPNKIPIRDFMNYVSVLMMLESPSVDISEKKSILAGLELDLEEPDSLDFLRISMLFFFLNSLQLPVWSVKVSALLGQSAIPNLLPFTSYYTSFKTIITTKGFTALFLVCLFACLPVIIVCMYVYI